MVKYVWQAPSWPDLYFDSAALLFCLGRARQMQGKLLGEARFFGLEFQAEVLTQEAVTTAAIEGERLNRDSVRSSIARRLGLPTAGLPASERHVDGLVEMLVDATQNHEVPLTAARFKGWQAGLFPTGYAGIRKIATGKWRSGEEPMRVVSGPIGKERVHFEAPPAREVDYEIKRFLAWFDSDRSEYDGLVRAAVAHFRFVTIHPFEDGNGRIARAITDMALARDEGCDFRLYSMSAQIISEREAYYDVLERTQKGEGDITEWVVWFLQCLERAVLTSDAEVKKAVDKARLWQELAHLDLNERQRKVIDKLSEAGPDGFEGGLTNRKYRGMTKTTRETAKRDLADLLAKGIIKRNPSGGRSISYDLVWPE